MLMESWTRSDCTQHRHRNKPAKLMQGLQKGPGLKTLGADGPCRRFRGSPAEQCPGSAIAPLRSAPKSQPRNLADLGSPSGKAETGQSRRSSREASSFGHMPRQAGGKVPTLSKKPKPTRCILGNTLWFHPTTNHHEPFLKHEAAPTGRAAAVQRRGAWAAPNFARWKVTNRVGWSQWEKRVSPSFPASKSQPPHPRQGAKSGELAGSCTIYIFCTSATPRGLRVSFSPCCQGARRHTSLLPCNPATRLGKCYPGKGFMTYLQLGKLRQERHHVHKVRDGSDCWEDPENPLRPTLGLLLCTALPPAPGISPRARSPCPRDRSPIAGTRAPQGKQQGQHEERRSWENLCSGAMGMWQSSFSQLLTHLCRCVFAKSPG